MTSDFEMTSYGKYLNHEQIGENNISSKIKDEDITIEHAETSIKRTWERRKRLIKRRAKWSLIISLLITYFVYFGYAMYCEFGDEGSIRLLVCTTFGVLYISGMYLFRTDAVIRSWTDLKSTITRGFSHGKRPRIVRWVLYVLFGAGCVAYVTINVGLKDPSKLRSLLGIYHKGINERVLYVLFGAGCVAYVTINVGLKDPSKLRSLLGIVTLVLFMVIISSNKRKIRWHTVFWGLIFQFLLGVLVLKTVAGKGAINWISARLKEFTTYAKSGSIFIFGPNYLDHPFAMATLPQIIVFCAFIQVLIHLGTIPFIVTTFGRLVAFLLDVSAPEAMNATANMFLAGAEATMIIRPYIDDMPTSHLFTIMTNAGASCAGAALIQFMQLGARPDYLLSASIMSVPAALACAKIIMPDDDDDVHDYYNKQVNDTVQGDKPSDHTKPKSDRPGGQHHESRGFIEALVQGTQVGVNMCVNLVGVQIVFNALVDMLDATVQWFGDRAAVHVTMKFLLGYLLYPVSYVIGVDMEDCRTGGELLGVKIATNALLGYQNLGQVIKNRETFDDYTQQYNGSYWHYENSDILLEKWNQTLTNGIITERSEVVLTYGMCGFASIASLGAALGVLGALVPSRLNDISKLVVPALFAGVIASLLTASVAGLIV